MSAMIAEMEHPSAERPTGLPAAPGGTSWPESRLEAVGTKRILVPLDLLPAGEAKLPIAMAQARAFGAEVVLLHVLSERDAADETGVTPAEAHAHAYLDAIALRMRSEGVAALPLIRYGPVAQTVVDVARDLKAELIVIGTNMRGGIVRLLPGAIADEIVHNAPCPVLLVRPTLDGAPPNPLLRSFAEDAAKAGPLAPRSLGLRTVEVARIIGTVGRAAELTADFRPIKPNEESTHRFRRLQEAFAAGKAIPPVELYKLGYGYYVLDGHHRVALAKQQHQLWIDSVVTEYVPLTEPEAQRIFTERVRFEQATALKRIGVARPGTYGRLEEFVREYAEEQHKSDLPEAARRWYADVFRPLQLAVRAERLTEHFPGERTADVALRVLDHWKQLAERRGVPMSQITRQEALVTFTP